MALQYRTTGVQKLYDPKLSMEERQRKAKKYGDMADGEARKRDDHTKRAKEYKEMLRTGKGGAAR